MIYVTDSQALYTDQGELIKYVNCPLATRLAREISAVETEREFNCMHCQTKVKNLAYFTDQEALETAEADKDVCFFATQAAKNVVHVTEPVTMHLLVQIRMRQKRKTEPERVIIRTARTRSEMNFAAANGFKLLFRRVGSGDGVRDQLAVYQDVRTGEVVYSNDRRFAPGCMDGPEKSYESVFKFFQYQPQGPVSPVAAYLIPNDLEPDTEVFVEDAIEDLICEMPQDTAERMSGWWAIWSGEDLNFIPHESGGMLG